MLLYNALESIRDISRYYPYAGLVQQLSNRKTILMYLVNDDMVKLLKVLLSLSSADGVWEKSFLTGSNALLLR